MRSAVALTPARTEVVRATVPFGERCWSDGCRGVGVRSIDGFDVSVWSVGSPSMTTIASEDQANDRGVTDDGVVVHDRPALPIVRNTVLLSAAQAVHSAMGALATAVASITLVRVLGRPRAAGSGTCDRARCGRACGDPGGTFDGPFRPGTGAGGRLLDRRRRLRCCCTRQCVGLAADRARWPTRS